jgi:predicted transcriptional regulator
VKEETMMEYVVRKLNDDAYNRAEMCRRTGVNKATASLIAKGHNKDPQFSTVEKLYRYFKELAE